jgi:hypothetical protein
MTLPAVTLMHPASEKVSRGRTAIFTNFLLDGGYLGPHGTPLAADQVERHDGPLAADV